MQCIARVDSETAYSLQLHDRIRWLYQEGCQALASVCSQCPHIYSSQALRNVSMPGRDTFMRRMLELEYQIRM